MRLEIEIPEGNYKSNVPFVAGQTAIPYAGRIYNEDEILAGIGAVVDFYLTGGKYTKEFEDKFAEFVGRHYAYLVNSGSSANLLALTALMSPLLGERALKPGDEVITVAAGFPTTLNPIIQNGLVPVFIDITLDTLDIDVSKIESALTKRTKAIMVAHTLGNPFDLDVIQRLADKYDLFVVEDCCDALGSTYKGVPVGSHGIVSTYSFYPAHHITMGEGGAVCTDDPLIAKAVHSLRDWGRECTCPPGKGNYCGHRYTGQYGSLPVGYDHKYVYSHIGYNLKATEIQAAIGIAQMDKLPDFIHRRKENFKAWEVGFKDMEEYFILPHATEGSDPAWFAYPITLKDHTPFTRTELTAYLEKNKVETRNLFGGNLLHQPAYRMINYKVVGGLKNTDYAMNNTFFLGTFPGMTQEMISYVITLIKLFIGEKK